MGRVIRRCKRNNVTLDCGTFQDMVKSQTKIVTSKSKNKKKTKRKNTVSLFNICKKASDLLNKECSWQIFMGQKGISSSFKV